MDTTRQIAPSLAPLAFSLSIRSEGVVSALGRNNLDPVSLTFYPGMLGVAGASACACLLYSFLPIWMSVPLAIWPGLQAFKYAKRYFEGSYADSRIKANREVLLKAVESPDVSYFADVAASVVKSHYGSQKWVEKAQLLRGVGKDPYMYLSAIFTHAPELWQVCAQKVYDQHIAGVVPNQQSSIS